MAERRAPSVARVVWSLGMLEARRWLNRTSRRRGREGSTRDATHTKRAPAKLLLVVVSAVLGLNVLNSATRIVYGVAFAAERSSRPGEVFVAPEVLRWLDTILADDRPVGVVQSTQREQLEELYEFEARTELALDRSERAARVDELRRVFATRGRAGFHASQLEHGVLPSTSLWFASDDPLVMVAPLAMIAALIAAAVLCLSMVGSDRDLARSDLTLEWLFSFPVPTRALLLARILSATLVNPVAWLLLAPFFFVVYWSAGHGPYWGLLLAGAASSYLTMLGGCLRVVAETGLRRVLATRAVAHVQAALEVLAALPLLLAFAATTKVGLGFVIAHGRGVPSVALFNPISLPMAWLLPNGAVAALASFAFLSAAVYGSVVFGSAMLRDGLVSASEPMLGSRTKVAFDDRANRSPFALLSTYELLALVREPARLARVLLVPLSVVIMPSLADPMFFRALISEPAHASAAAFGVGAFVLVGGGLPTLANEGAGLWLLYTTPWSLDAILARRAAFWALLACAAVAAALTTLAVIAREPAFLLNAHAALALIGTGIYGFAAVALGALGTDVTESTRVRRLQPFTGQLFLLLTGMFTFALYTDSWWVKLVQLSLSALFAFALWQKLRDHTPYLLDPTEAPPPAIAVADGIFAALAFFVLQGLLGLLLVRLGLSPGVVLLFAFAGAGTIVSVAAVWTLARSGVPDLMRTLGLAVPRRPLRSAGLGVLAGLGAGAGAALYTRAIFRFEWLRRWYEEGEQLDPTPDQLIWLGALAVCAAPLCEELLFRGILYRGLRRSLGAHSAIFASALVFALVHPATSFVPVFVMALGAATVFELSGSLLAPVLTHMIYNGIVVALALWP